MLVFQPRQYLTYKHIIEKGVGTQLLVEGYVLANKTKVYVKKLLCVQDFKVKLYNNLPISQDEKFFVNGTINHNSNNNRVMFSNLQELKTVVEKELTSFDLSERQDLFLKARLKNLVAIDGFLSGPEKAKAALESYLGKLKRGD